MSMTIVIGDKLSFRMHAFANRQHDEKSKKMHTFLIWYLTWIQIMPAYPSKSVKMTLKPFSCAKTKWTHKIVTSSKELIIHWFAKTKNRWLCQINNVINHDVMSNGDFWLPIKAKCKRIWWLFFHSNCKKDETKERERNNNNNIHTLLAAFSLKSHSGG